MNEILTLIEKVKNDRQNGASHLALQSLEILKTAAYQSSAVSPQLWAEEIIGYGHLLIEARPAMTPISSLVNEFISIIRIKAAGFFRLRSDCGGLQTGKKDRGAGSSHIN